MRRARNLPLAFGIWPLCFSLWAAGTALAGSELDSSVLIPSCIVGAIVSAAVSQLSTGWKKVRAGIFGLLIGAMPLLLDCSWQYSPLRELMPPLCCWLSACG